MEKRQQTDKNAGPARKNASDPTPSARRRASVVFLLLLLMVLSLIESGCDLFWEPVPKGKKGAVSVMSRNLYVGADISTVLTADPSTLPLVVGQLFETVQTTNFPERARAIAEEIENAHPDVIGLQEVALFRIQSPSDFNPADPTPNATTVWQDFLAILMDELATRGLEYRVVNEVENADIELPAFDGSGVFDLRLTDRDVILAREEVRITSSDAEHFTTNLPLPFRDAQGNPLQLLRGYGVVTAKVRGLTFTLVNTHLETAAGAPIQVAQAVELLDEIDDVRGPLVVLGDFNSAAPGASTPVMDTDTYGLLDAEYTDAWSDVNPGETGYTCCQAADLANGMSLLAWRIDQIWYGEGVEAVIAERLGEEASDRTPSGLWPSDHAGVAALLRINRK